MVTWFSIGRCGYLTTEGSSSFQKAFGFLGGYHLLPGHLSGQVTFHCGLADAVRFVELDQFAKLQTDLLVAAFSHARQWCGRVAYFSCGHSVSRMNWIWFMVTWLPAALALFGYASMRETTQSNSEKPLSTICHLNDSSRWKFLKIYRICTSKLSAGTDSARHQTPHWARREVCNERTDRCLCSNVSAMICWLCAPGAGSTTWLLGVTRQIQQLGRADELGEATTCSELVQWIVRNALPFAEETVTFGASQSDHGHFIFTFGHLQQLDIQTDGVHRQVSVPVFRVVPLTAGWDVLLARNELVDASNG